MPPSHYNAPPFNGTEQRIAICRDWLAFVTASPPADGETKEAVCVETMKVCRVSRSTFEECWREALERTRNAEWRSFRFGSRTNARN